MRARERMDGICAALEELYPDPSCALLWGGKDPWRLLVLARLSAQCTDARVNLVAPALFEAFPNVFAMANAKSEEVEPYIASCGLYRRKAYDLVESAKQIVSDFGGKVPRDMNELLSLSGVGRKIAHLIRGDVFGLPAIVCDTHLIRICGRLGFYDAKEKNPLKVEKHIEKVITPEKSSDFCHRIVLFGRDICSARAPMCSTCPINEKGLCKYGKAHS